MGKTLTRDQRKNSNKYAHLEEGRRLKFTSQFSTPKEKLPKREKPRPKWRPHSEIEVD